MAGEKKQKKRAKLAGPNTPKKTRRPDNPVIGSSSTWKDEQLDLFKVIAGEVDVKEMIPEKWFDYGTLQNYQSGANEFLVLSTKL